MRVSVQRLTLLAVLLCFPLAANAAFSGFCQPAKVVAGESRKGCLRVDGQARRYRLFVPKLMVSSDQPLRILVGLHGGGGSAKRFESYSRFSELAAQQGNFVALYPVGLNKHWNDGRASVNADVDDVRFIKHLLRHVQQLLGRPESRLSVYLAGMSNGGLMALRLACERPTGLAGVAVVAAAMTQQLSKHCQKSSSPLPLLLIYGNQDTAFLSDGRLVNPVKPRQLRGRHVGFAKTEAYWARVNGCADHPVVHHVDRVASDRTRIVDKRYTGCRALLRSVQVEGGGHRWPDSRARNGRLLVKRLNLGLASQEVDAGAVIISTFRAAAREPWSRGVKQ